MAFDNLSEKLQNVFKQLRSKGSLTEADVKAALKEVKMALLEADVNFKVVRQFTKTVQEKAIGQDVMNGLNPGQMVIKIVHDELVSLMGNEKAELPLKPGNEITVYMMIGLQGAGKTTTAAKLASMYQKQGKKTAFVAADTFRAGAIDQLAEWGERLNVPVVKGRENGDPSAAIVDGTRYAKEHGIDILLCDTAGRLQNKAGLMAELSKMNRVAGREIEGAPHDTWLVLDATTGQNGLHQAEVFNEATNLTGLILTKMDGTAKGGIIISIKHKLKLPVLYIGLGEKPEDLRPFDLDSYLYSISEGLQDA